MIKHIFKLIWNKKRSNALMVLEIFLSFIVLFVVVGYVLFNLDIIEKPLGFETEDRWIIRLDNQVSLQDSLTQVTSLQNLRSELLAHQNVESVSFLESIAPFNDNNWRNPFTDQSEHQVVSNLMPVDIDYKDLMGVEIIEGRWFNEDDMSSPHIKMVVNSMWMDDYPNQSMIDSVYTMGDNTYQIVGVVDQNRYRGEFSEEVTTMYFLKHFYENSHSLVMLMTPGTTANVEESISKIVNSTTNTTGSSIDTLDKLKTESSRHSWVLMIGLLSICGFLCINVALGLFGVLWYTINKRRGEIGLRQAVGAHGTDITIHFILEILMITAFALGLGVFFAIQIPLLEVTEYPASLFYRAIFYATLIILGLVLLCALLPSMQAAKIRPAIALHED